MTSSDVCDTTGSLPMLLDDGQRKYVYGPSGVIYEMDKVSGSPYVLHTDAQGSVRVITDSLANVVETYSNDAYGNPLITLSATPPNNAASQPRQYTAEPRDPETGFIYLRARMYDPSSGRFLQRDAVRGCPSPKTFNRYAYVSQNPLTRTDASGNCDDDPGDPCDEEMGRIGSGGSGVPAGRALLNELLNGVNVIVKYGSDAFVNTALHHVLPQQSRTFFEIHGIADIDEYLARIPARIYHAIHSGSGGWRNDRWDAWIQANPNARSDAILDFASQLIEETHVEPYIT